MEAALVQKALKQREEGKRRKKSQAKDPDLYAALLEQVRGEKGVELSAEEVVIKRNILEALAAVAPRLSGHPGHASLVDAVFEAESGDHPAVVAGLSTAVTSLTSHKSTYAGRAFGTLLRVSASSAAPAEALEAAVDGLSALLTLCPQGIKALCGAMQRYYPWSGKDLGCHAHYVEVLLALCERHELVEASVIDLVVRRALELDTEVDVAALSAETRRRAADDAADDHEHADDDDDDDDDAADVFQLDDEAAPGAKTPRRTPSTLPVATTSATTVSAAPSKARQSQSDDDTAAKLDAVMTLLLRYADARLWSGASAEALVASALDVFEAAVMHTHESKFVQFLVFKVCASTQDRAHRFASRLIRVAADPLVGRVVRLSAVAYLASFVCRAKTVLPALAHECATTLFAWADTAAIAIYGAGPGSPPRRSRDDRPARGRRAAADDDDDAGFDHDDDDDDGRRRPKPSEAKLAESFAAATSLAASPHSLKVMSRPDSGRRGVNPRRDDPVGDTPTPSVFAALLHALLYVVCFRGDDILPAGDQTVPETGAHTGGPLADSGRWLTLLAAGDGDGLKRCDKRVKTEFIKVCDRSRVFDHSTLERIRVLAKPTAVAAARNGSRASARDALGGADADDDAPVFFYPFDPYLLPTSRHYVAPTYRDWTDRHDGDDDEDDDDGDDDSDRPSQLDAGFRSPGSVSPDHFGRSADKPNLGVSASPTSLSNSVMSIEGQSFSDRRVFDAPHRQAALPGAASDLRRPRLDSAISHEGW